MSYSLKNVREFSLTTPTFEVPTVQEIAQHCQKDGAFVKLVFEEEGEKMSERMWVSVISFDPKTEVGLGTLNNDPYNLESVKCGDTVEFRGHHVCGLC
jgi:uncharacterized protein YegJ (DUF2314 family)